jgi:hypothetical protein
MNSKIQNLDPRFENVEYLIEADDFAQEQLYIKYNEKYNWIWDRSGLIYIIGSINNCNIGISCNFAKLNGYRVCFYYSDGVIVDWNMINDWLNTNVKCKNKTDAMNFSQLLQYINSK